MSSTTNHGQGASTMSITSTTETRTTQVAEDIAHSITRTEARVTEAAAKLATASQSSIDSQWSYLTEYAEAVAERDVFAQLAHVAQNLAVRESDNPAAEVTDAHLVAAMRHLAAEFTQGLITNRYRGGSTNAMSNAAAAAKAEAVCRFVQDAQGRLAYIDREVAA